MHNSTQVSPTSAQFMMNNSQSPFRTRIEWVSQLSVYQDPGVYRKTSIICTIGINSHPSLSNDDFNERIQGPKTNSVEAIQKLRKAGMNIARLNFSHGTYEVCAVGVVPYWSLTDYFTIIVSRVCY